MIIFVLKSLVPNTRNYNNHQSIKMKTTAMSLNETEQAMFNELVDISQKAKEESDESKKIKLTIKKQENKTKLMKTLGFKKYISLMKEAAILLT